MVRKQEGNMKTIVKYQETKRQQENKKGLTTRKQQLNPAESYKPQETKQALNGFVLNATNFDHFKQKQRSNYLQ